MHVKALHLLPTWSMLPTHLYNNIIMIIQETITNLIVHQYNTNIIILTKYYTKHNNITHHIINIYETDRLIILFDKFVHFVGFKFTPQHAINF